MALWKRGENRLARAFGRLKKELLRDPDVILFEQRPEPEGSPSRNAIGAR
ncbi:MAG TPA: hypothetical protein VF509_09170 [Sphingobium sp.]